MHRLISTVLVWCWLGSNSQAGAAEPGALFASHEPLAIEIFANFRNLCDDPDRQECPDLPALIVYQDSAGIEHRIETGLRVRGRWKEITANCTLPSLFLISEPDAISETLFEGQDSLPLATHCRNTEGYEQYLLKEFLAYRLYNALTDKSLRVRLVQIAYHETNGLSSTRTRYGFFIEHFRALAERVGATVWEPPGQFDPAESDTFELDVQALFQYMIGNTDWSILAGHNILYLRGSDWVTPVPFDFDYSGLVNAAYAAPDPKLGLRFVTQRAYRGFCREDSDWPELFSYFDSRYDTLFELAAAVPDLSRSQKRRVERYLESFYEILQSERKREVRIVQRCR